MFYFSTIILHVDAQCSVSILTIFLSLISEKNCCIGCDFLPMQQLESDKSEVQKCTANAYKVSKMQQCCSF